jgi:hypothetical protein
LLFLKIESLKYSSGKEYSYYVMRLMHNIIIRYSSHKNSQMI